MKLKSIINFVDKEMKDMGFSPYSCTDKLLFYEIVEAAKVMALTKKEITTLIEEHLELRGLK